MRLDENAAWRPVISRDCISHGPAASNDADASINESESIDDDWPFQI
jgi:hypothetical protein